MLYGGNFGRTTYGGIIRRVTSAFAAVFRKARGIILSLARDKNILLTKRKGTVLKSKSEIGVIKTRDRAVILASKNDQGIALGTGRKSITIHSTSNSGKIRNRLEVKTLTIKSNKNILRTNRRPVITKSTGRVNPSVL
jgi:hypothetical protein